MAWGRNWSKYKFKHTKPEWRPYLLTSGKGRGVEMHRQASELQSCSKHIFIKLSPYLGEATSTVQQALLWIVKLTQRDWASCSNWGRCSATWTALTGHDSGLEWLASSSSSISSGSKLYAAVQPTLENRTKVLVVNLCSSSLTLVGKVACPVVDRLSCPPDTGLFCEAGCFPSP